MLTIVITISGVFLKGHPRQGAATDFKQKVLDHIKQHTIRADEKGYWRKAIKQVAEGKAVLSVRQWSGKPYASKQVEVCQFTKEDGVDCCDVWVEYPNVHFFDEPNSINFANQVAERDGLTLADFWGWFGKRRQKLLLIHFNDFRYVANQEAEVF